MLEKRFSSIQPFRSISTFKIETEVMKSYVKDLFAAKINMVRYRAILVFRFNPFQRNIVQDEMKN